MISIFEIISDVCLTTYNVFSYQFEIFQFNFIDVKNDNNKSVAAVAGHNVKSKFVELLKSDHSFLKLPNSTTKYLINEDEIGAIGPKNESTNSSGKQLNFEF